MQKPLGSHGTGVSVSQVHPSQAMADVLWILLLDSVNKKDRPQYEGRLVDMATGKWCYLAHPFTATGKQARVYKP